MAVGEEQPCLVCKIVSPTKVDFDTGTHQVKCPFCGRYDVTKEAAMELEHQGRHEIPVGRYRGWIWEQSAYKGSVPLIDSASNAVIRKRTPMPLSAKPDRLLLRLCDYPYPPDQLPLDYVGTLAMGRAEIASDDELVWLVELLEKRGLVDIVRVGLGSEPRVVVKQEGYIKAEELRSSPINSAQAFVAMWFDKQMDSAWLEGFKLGIENAGWDPYRVDKGHTGRRVDDEIIMQIRRSKFLVADFTGVRGGVYFEAGFADGLGRTVIWTCRKSDFENEKPHFDVDHFSFIRWETPPDLADQLHKRIEALIGRGPRDLSQGQ